MSLGSVANPNKHRVVTRADFNSIAANRQITWFAALPEEWCSLTSVSV